MAQDHLGLFDTPPNRRQIRLGLALTGLLFGALLFLSALPDMRWREIDAFIPMVDVIMCLGDLITAILLYAQANLFRSRALTVLGSGYVFTAVMVIAHVLTFPGAFAPDGLLGAGLSTTGWIGGFWRAAPPIAIIFYALLKRADLAARPSADRPSARVAAGIFVALVLAGAITLLTTRGNDLLPQMFVDRYNLNHVNFLRLSWVLITLPILALITLFPNRKSLLDMWLLVALAGWLANALLNAQSPGRFSANFYCGFAMLLFSHFVLLLVLIAESNRLHARLALTTAARDRERDGRLMSIDAVTAAIAHEIGQPLTGTIASAMAGLRLLTGKRPDRERAINAVHDAIDAGNRTKAVVKSIRAMFAAEPATPTEINLNDLARETAALLDRELAGGKVALEFNLDEALPPILADRVQIQRVLVNLLTNAIDSLGATRGRPRRIAIRSAPLNGQDVLLEIKDTGIGIEPEAMTRIFEPFFTTKKTGTGLGLSLCRTIVEEHGGRLWASPDELQGATFHLQLPRNDWPNHEDLGSGLTTGGGRDGLAFVV